MPAIILAVELSAVIVRVLSSSVTAIMQESYVQAGVVRGLSMGHMIRHHVLRNSSIPMLNLFGAQLGGLLLGSMFVVEYLRGSKLHCKRPRHSVLALRERTKRGILRIRC